MSGLPVESPIGIGSMKRLFGIALLVGAVMICGAGVWIGAWGSWEARPLEVPSDHKEESAVGEPSPGVAMGPPKLVIDATDHDFGTMEPMTKAEHVFVVRNEGNGPLELTPGGTTCKCTLSDLPERTVPPGKQGRIVVSWNTTEKHGAFRQVATIRTNDPDRPSLDLKILGTVWLGLVVEPEQVRLSGHEPGKAAMAEVLVFSQRWPEFSVVKTAFSRSGPTCVVEPADPAQLKERQARAGYRLKITLPGDLTSGCFSEWLRIEVDPRDGKRSRETRQITLAGEVPSRTEVFGRKLALNNVLTLGALRQGEPARERLTLVLRDEPRRMAVRRIESRPEFLRVHVVPLGSEESKAGVYRIDVEVPPDAPASNFMGANRGEIVIVTDHPTMPRLRLGVELAVLSN